MRKTLVFALAAASLCVSAAAQTQPMLRSFLVSQWIERGNQFCKYDNGTVLNVGINLCPLSIPA